MMIPQAPFPAAILVVEDDEDTRTLYVDLLEMAGYRVVEAATGRAALDTLARDAFDLLLLDRRLPDLDGIDVCKALRAQYGARIPVLLVTADADPSLEAAARAADVTELIHKPFRSDQLLERIREHLTR